MTSFKHFGNFLVTIAQNNKKLDSFKSTQIGLLKSLQDGTFRCFGGQEIKKPKVETKFRDTLSNWSSVAISDLMFEKLGEGSSSYSCCCHIVIHIHRVSKKSTFSLCLIKNGVRWISVLWDTNELESGFLVPEIPIKYKRSIIWTPCTMLFRWKCHWINICLTNYLPFKFEVFLEYGIFNNNKKLG